MKKYILSFLFLLSSLNVMAQGKGLDQRIDEEGVSSSVESLYQ